MNVGNNLTFISYRHALALVGLRNRAPEYVKMDIEGFEWTVLSQLVRSPLLMPRQLALEVHLTTHMRQLPWAGRFKSPAEAVALGLQLSRAGYHIVSREDSPVCHWCTEMLLVLDPCLSLKTNGPNSIKSVRQAALAHTTMRWEPSEVRDASESRKYGRVVH